MKKKVWLILLAVMAYLVFVGVNIYKQKKQERREREYELEIQYKWQNRAFPRRGGDLNLFEYSPYEKVDEKELSIRLTVYNQEHPGEAGLKPEDIKEYLEKEKNEDGSLRVETGYEKIHDYVEWYGHGGAEKAEDYWTTLDYVAIEYRAKNPHLKINSVKQLTQPQIEELIKKEADPTYEINDEVMEGRE